MTPTLMRRSALFTVLSVIAVLLVTMMAGPALGQSGQLSEATASPAPSLGRSPTLDALGDFTHVPGAGAPSDLDWRPVTEPALEPGASLSRLTAWAGGFAAIEERRDPETGWQHAIWSSPDGFSWARSPLPARVRLTWWLLPFGDGLVLTTSRHRGYSSERFKLDVWRSSDGATWRRVGSVSASLPRRLKQERYWGVVPVEFIATDRGLTLLASVVYSQGAGGSTHDATIFVSDDTSAPVRATSRPARMWGWTSRDGSEWVRRRVIGVVAPDGYGFVHYATQAGARIIATRGHGEALLSSRDGLRWRVDTPLSSDFEGGVSEALLWTADGVILLGDNDEEEGAEFCGDRLGAWRLDDDGSWMEVLDRQPAGVHGAAAEDAWVMLTGESWCAGEWGWILVSSDGGRTWDPDLSWTGPLESCRGDVAINDGTAVVLACTPRYHNRATADEPPMWWAQLPPPSA